MNRFAAPRDAVPVQVDFKAVGADHARLPDVAMYTAEHGTYPRNEFTRRKRFGDVIVRAEFQPDQAVSLTIAGREHDDRHVRIAAQNPAHIDSVHAGQIQVEHDEIGPFVAGYGDGRRAVIGRQHFEARLFQVILGQLDYFGFVVHYHNQFVHRA